MARLGQFRRDTAANWESANPIIADGEFILIATNPGAPKVYDAQKVGDGQTRYNDLPMRGFECVQELGIGTTLPLSQWQSTQIQAIAESLFGKITIIPNALANLPGGGAPAYMIASSTYDCALIRIFESTGTLQVSGVAKANYFAFWSTDFTDEGWLGSNSTGAIPTGAKWCVIDFKKEDNPEGLSNLKVIQNKMTVDLATYKTATKDLYQGNTVKERYLYDVVFYKDLEELPTEEFLGQWFNPLNNTITDNDNFNMYRLDVSSMAYNILHVVTQTHGSMWSITFADANNVAIQYYQYANNVATPIDVYIQVPNSAKYLYVNNWKNGDIRASVYSVNTGERITAKKLMSSQVAARDGLGASGLMYIYPNTRYSSGTSGILDGDILSTKNFHMGVYRLQSNKGTVVISKGVFGGTYAFYGSENFSHDTLIERNNTGVIPVGSKYLLVNFPSNKNTLESLFEVEITHEGNLSAHEAALRKGTKKLIKKTSTLEGYFISNSGVETSSATYAISDFPYNGEKNVRFTGAFSGSGIFIFHFFNKDGVRLGVQYQRPNNYTTEYANNYKVNVPIGTSVIRINHTLNVAPTLVAYDLSDYMDAVDVGDNIKEVKNNLREYEDTPISPISEVTGKLIRFNGEEGDNASFRYSKFSVPQLGDNDVLLFSAEIGSNTQIAFVVFYDAENVLLGYGEVHNSSVEGDRVTENKKEIWIPQGTAYVCVNSRLSVTPQLYKRAYGEVRDFEAVEDAMTKFTEVDIPMTSTVVGEFLKSSDGQPSTNANFHYDTYNIDGIDGELYFSGGVGGNTQISFIMCYGSSEEYIGDMFPISTPSGGSQVYDKQAFVVLEGTKVIKINSSNSYKTSLMYKRDDGFYDIAKMDEDIKRLDITAKKLMKVHVYGTTTDNNANLFYVRTPYNKTKDIILLYYTNLNGLISPKAAYVGPNSLTDSALMASSYLVSSHSDSTAPLFNSSLYWHLFAQHGYVIPYVANTVGMTSVDVGTTWKDQLDRQYKIGNVTSSYIYLLPVITLGAEGQDTRGWKTPNDTKITTLTPVSSATITDPIPVATQYNTQLRPIMKSYDRKWLIDGKEITAEGDYECDDFRVSESQIGYDPARISAWFPTPNLTGALEMARFTWSYNFKGANCAVNTTIDIRRKVECQSYGACQQQFFLDNGNYKAMFLIPKAAARNGVELDKPFNSPATTSTSYGFYRNSTLLKDVDKPIDRLIGFLQKENTKDFLVGMAAGLSLVSGDTVTEKRNQNIAVATDTNNAHQRLGSFSPSNTNKFYIAAVNTAPFADDGYNFPNTYFKEINYYVSYFDPAENEGQVYWYKDGDKYVIYLHCQTAQNRLAINLPAFMEGLNVEIVEKTDGATLLTEAISNGKLYVTYTNEANYIVLKTR